MEPICKCGAIARWQYADELCGIVFGNWWCVHCDEPVNREDQEIESLVILGQR